MGGSSAYGGGFGGGYGGNDMGYMDQGDPYAFDITQAALPS